MSPTSRPWSPAIHSRTFGRAAAYAAQSLVDVVTRSLSPVGAQGYASMLFDAPTTMSPCQMATEWGTAETDTDPRFSPSPLSAGSTPYSQRPQSRPVRLEPTVSERSESSEHAIPMESIVVPQARRGAVFLNARRRRRRRQRSQRSFLQAWSMQVILLQLRSFLQLLLHPKELYKHVHQCVASQWKCWDESFRDPTTHARCWWPDWLRAYTPLMIWVCVSLTSTFLVMLFHTPLFHLLNTLSLALRNMGWMGRVLFGLLIFMTTFPPMPLYSTMIVLAGYTFGVWQGFLVSYIAALSGAVAVFILSRTWLRGWMARMLTHAGSLKRIVHAIELEPRLLFLIRLAPYPYNLLNTLLASSHVLTLRTYMTCTALALPKLLVHTSIGSSLESFATYHASPKGDTSSSLPTNDGTSSSPGVLVSHPQRTSHSQRTETIRQVASVVGILLCMGVFVYLYFVTQCAVDKFDDGLDFDSVEYDTVSETDMETDDTVEAEGKDSIMTDDVVHVPLMAYARRADSQPPHRRTMTPMEERMVQGPSWVESYDLGLTSKGIKSEPTWSSQSIAALEQAAEADSRHRL